MIDIKDTKQTRPRLIFLEPRSSLFIERVILTFWETFAYIIIEILMH